MTDDGLPPRSDLLTFIMTVRGTNTPVVTEVPPPALYSFAVPAGQMTFTIETIPGRTYRVQYTDDLGAVAWTSLGPDFVAANPYASLSDPARAAHRFYRVFRLD